MKIETNGNLEIKDIGALLLIEINERVNNALKKLKDVRYYKGSDKEKFKKFDDADLKVLELDKKSLEYYKGSIRNASSNYASNLSDKIDYILESAKELE